MEQWIKDVYIRTQGQQILASDLTANEWLGPDGGKTIGITRIIMLNSKTLQQFINEKYNG